MRRKMVSLLLVFALVFTLSSGVFAADSHTGDGGISPQYINYCPGCESTMSLDCGKWDYGYAGKWVDTGSNPVLSESLLLALPQLWLHLLHRQLPLLL